MPVSGKMSSKIRLAHCLSRQASFSGHFHWIVKSNFIFLHRHLYAESFLKGLLYSIVNRVFSLPSMCGFQSPVSHEFTSAPMQMCAQTHTGRGDFHSFSRQDTDVDEAIQGLFFVKSSPVTFMLSKWYVSSYLAEKLYTGFNDKCLNVTACASMQSIFLCCGPSDYTPVPKWTVATKCNIGFHRKKS